MIYEKKNSEKSELFESPRLTGAGMIEQEDHFAVIGHDNQGALSLQTYDFSLHPIDRILIPFADQGIVNYWSSTIYIQEITSHLLQSEEILSKIGLLTLVMYIWAFWIENTTSYLGTNSPISFRKKVEE